MRGDRETGTIRGVDDPETTQLMLEALFDIKATVFEIHRGMFGGEDEEEEEDA